MREDLGFRGGFAQAASVLVSTNRIRIGLGILPAAARNVAIEAVELALTRASVDRDLSGFCTDRLIRVAGEGTRE